MVMGHGDAGCFRHANRSKVARPVYEFHLNGVELALPKRLATPSLREKLGNGTYEEDEARGADRCVRPGFRVLELGAGIGYVTTICAQRAGPENVLSVEANPALLPVIEGNLRRNGVPGVTVIHAAVTGPVPPDATGHLGLTGGYTGSSLKEGGRGLEVPLVSVHELIRVQKPHVVLMDIEGAEADLFSRPWNCPLRFCVMELHPKKYPPSTIKKIFDFMSAMDMSYDPITSRGKIVGFRKVWGATDATDAPDDAAPPA